MKAYTTILCSLLALTASVVASATLVPVGIRVVGGSPDMQMRPFNWSEGLTLALAYQHAEGGLIELDADASKLDSMTDDRGKSLIPEDDFGYRPFGHFTSISEDGSKLILEVNGGVLPSAEARSVTAKGSLVLIEAHQRENEKIESVTLRKGISFQLAGVDYKIVEIGKPQWGDAPVAVTFEVKQPVNHIAELKASDAAGNDLGLSQSSTSTMNLLGIKQTQITYTLDQKVTEFSLEASYWSDLKRIELPFEVTTSLGVQDVPE